MADKDDIPNFVAYASRKRRRVTISVLASDLLGFVEGYDAASGIASQVSEILGVQLPIWCAVDSRTVFNVITRLGVVTEKRLMPDTADSR